MGELSREQELEIKILSLEGQVKAWEYKYNRLLEKYEKQKSELSAKKVAFKDIEDEFGGLDF